MTENKTLSKRKAALLITGFAFFLKVIGIFFMGYVDFPEFYRDYGMVSKIAAGQIVLLGPASLLHGFHFGPIYYYLFIPLFFLFNKSPLGLILTGVVFSTLSVWMFYKVLILWFNSSLAACLGALYLAISVYDLHLYSFVSNPNFLPFFVLWFFYHLTKILNREFNNYDIICLALSYGFASQLHPTAMIVLFLTALCTLILNKYKLKLAYVIYFISFFILTYLPYLFYEITHKFSNTRRLFELGRINLTGTNPLSGTRVIWNFFEGSLTPFNDWYTFSNIQPNILYLPIAFIASLTGICLLWKFIKNKGLRQTSVFFSDAGKQICFFWILTTCVTLLLFKHSVRDYYIIILWPAPIVFLTYITLWIKAKFENYLLAVILIILISLLQIISFYQKPNTPWSNFLPTYQKSYQNNPNLSEIDS